MKEAQRLAITKLMVGIAKTVGLNGWTVGLSDKQAEGDDVFACVIPVRYRRMATVYLCPEFVTIGHRDILHVCIHEVLHLYFVDIKWAIEDLFEAHVLGAEAHAVFTSQNHMLEELAVDQMASAWADLMWEWDSVQKALLKITKQVERTAP